jgi:ATP-dependent Lon protease
LALIPEENVKDLAEIPDTIKNRIEILPVRWIDKVLELALERMPEPLPDQAAAPAVAVVADDAAVAGVVTH